MSSPYVGEIRIFAGNYAPAGWAFCNGATLAISENETLFNLIGTTYGGDGQSTFNLPNLQSRVPRHMGSSAWGTFIIGDGGGVETVTLTAQQVPAHNHALLASGGPATDTHPAGKVLARSPLPTTFPYGTDAPTTVLHPGSMSATGGSQPHDNLQPYLCVNFIISLFGIYPSQT